MSRNPIETATIATEIEASSSSAKPERKETRSTRMVSRRYDAVTFSIDDTARYCRLNSFSVDSPRTVSAKRAASRPRVCHCAFCTARVARPMSTMNRGMSGIVRMTVRPEIQSCHHITATRIGVAMTVSTSCGR